jgi:hypothetical protein
MNTFSLELTLKHFNDNTSLKEINQNEILDQCEEELLE